MVSIKEFFELREAGYTVEQIKEYSSFIEAPEPEQKPEQKPEELLQQILNAVRQSNVNNSNMPEQQTRTANEILAEIINPKKGRDPK